MATRVGRNSIPKVNPNPRPPNEPRIARHQQARSPVGRAQALPRPRTGVGQGHALPSPQRPGGSAIAQAPSPSSPPPAALAPAIDPRDSKYWQDVAQLKFDTDLAKSNLDVEETFQKSAFDREKANRDYTKPLEVQRLRENANVSGTIYSTATQENLGNLAQEQFSKDAQASEAFQYALAQRLGQRKGLESEYNKNMARYFEDATERQALQEIERAALADEEIPYESPAVQAMEQRATGKKPKPKAKPKQGIPSNKPAHPSIDLSSAKPAAKRRSR